MKTFLSMLSMAAIIICISCNPKTKKLDKNTYSEAQKEYLKKLQQPFQAELSPKEMEAYLEEVKPFREEFDKTLDAMSPGLLKKYLDDAKELNDTKDTSRWQEMISKMEKKYKEPFMKAWQKSSIADKIENINEKYFKKYKCIKGDFGSTIVIINHTLDDSLGSVRDSVGGGGSGQGGSSMGSDRTIDSGCPLEVREHQSGCGFIALGGVSSGDLCTIDVGLISYLAGGCDVEGRIGKSFSIPAQYTDITADFTADYSIIAYAQAFLGGGWASAEVGIKINENGTDKISSALAGVTAVAPVIWSYRQDANAVNQHFIASYHRSSSTGNVNVIPKLYLKATSGGVLDGAGNPGGNITNITALRISLHQE